MSTHHVIVGSGVAALSAAETIRQAEPGARITLVSREAHPFYSRPGLAYLLTGSVPERQLAIRTPEEVQALRIERRTDSATALDPRSHTLRLANGAPVRYDRLLLAVGAASMAPPLENIALRGIVRLDGLDDARGVLAMARRGKTGVVIGGGCTALELAEGLHARGMHTHYLLRGDRFWARVLDADESSIVESRLEAENVRIHRHTSVTRVVGRDGRLVGIETNHGEHIACDILALSIGVRPRLGLAHTAQIDTDRGILTDEFLETSAADVFAAGDAAQVRDPDTGEALLDTLWTSALEMGRSAGKNMAGMRAPHVKAPAMNVTRLAGLTTTIIGAVGGGSDPDLLTITRGQSERWTADTSSWTLGGGRAGDRLRVLIGDRSIVGAVVIGDQALSTGLTRLIADKVDVSALRPSLEARPEAGVAMLSEFIALRDRRDDGPR